MIETTEKPFNYYEYLQNLKIGDSVRLGRCRHNHVCTCDLFKVISIDRDGRPEPHIVIEEKCTVRYFSLSNGRELAGRKGVYRQASIVPYTEIDKKEKERQLALSKLYEVKSEIYEEINNIFNSGPKVKTEKYMNYSKIPLCRLKALRSHMILFRQVDSQKDYTLHELEERDE